MYDQETILKEIRTKWAGKTVHFAKETDSTNEWAKRLSQEGAPHGTLAVAEFQSAGKGRLGRRWQAPEGSSVMMSLLLKPEFEPRYASMQTVVMGLSVAQAIQKTGTEVSIKWPNDVLLNGKKLVGILTEMSAEFGHINYLVVGIGINVCVPHDMVPEELRPAAISIADAAEGKVDRVALLAKVLDYLEYYYDIACREGFGPILDQWRDYSITLGKQVKVIAPDKTYVGTALDIDETGALQVKKEDGTVETVLAGDVSIRPAQGKGKYA